MYNFFQLSKFDRERWGGPSPPKSTKDPYCVIPSLKITPQKSNWWKSNLQPLPLLAFGWLPLLSISLGQVFMIEN